MGSIDASATTKARKCAARDLYGKSADNLITPEATAAVMAAVDLNDKLFRPFKCDNNTGLAPARSRNADNGDDMVTAPVTRSLAKRFRDSLAARYSRRKTRRTIKAADKFARDRLAGV